MTKFKKLHVFFMLRADELHLQSLHNKALSTPKESTDFMILGLMLTSWVAELIWLIDKQSEFLLIAHNEFDQPISARHGLAALQTKVDPPYTISIRLNAISRSSYRFLANYFFTILDAITRRIRLRWWRSDISCRWIRRCCRNDRIRWTWFRQI